jgi:hypothetical protein
MTQPSAAKLSKYIKNKMLSSHFYIYRFTKLLNSNKIKQYIKFENK